MQFYIQTDCLVALHAERYERRIPSTDERQIKRMVQLIVQGLRTIIEAEYGRRDWL
jgi:hypothetical protein